MATSELDGLSSLLSGPGALSSGLNQGSNRAGIDQQNSASGQHSSVGAPVAPVAAFNAEPSQRSRRGRTVASGRALPHGLTMAVDATAREIQAVFQNFLRDFYVNNPEEKLYLIQIERMLSVEQTTIYVDWLHLAEFNQDLADAILEEFYRYESYLRSGVETVVREVQPPNLDERMENSNKQYYVSFYNYNRVSKIREIRSENIGQLMAISGTVTRTSEVRPELIFGTFSCQQCGQVVRDILQQFKYTTVSSSDLFIII
jgi:DNA replication licensing factor MCM6